MIADTFNKVEALEEVPSLITQLENSTGGCGICWGARWAGCWWCRPSRSGGRGAPPARPGAAPPRGSSGPSGCSRTNQRWALWSRDQKPPITAHLAPHDAAVRALVLLPAELHDLGPDELLQMICRRRSGDKGNIGTETLSVSVWFVNSAVSV